MDFVVFSGGTACNHILKAFHKLSNNEVNYVLGISDNGGSTSELLRVLGGPSVGDLRSRLIKLMDLIDERENQETIAIKNLLSYRLPIHPQVRDEWSLILEGRHKLWNHISVEKRETIRGFLTLFDMEILKRAHKRFNFCHGSIGNFLLTGARLFTGSLEAALFLFASITGVPGLVTPVINTNQTATIAATLMNGSTLVGQCEISHPSTSSSVRRKNPIDLFSPDEQEEESNTNLFFSKKCENLSSPIQRIYYINEYGKEIYPVPNPKVISQLSSRHTLIYSIGSLYTSLIPCLVLREIGNAIAQSQTLKHKIFLLNGSQDRETHGYSALDFIGAITHALHESQRIDARRTFYDQPAITQMDTPPSSYPPFPDHLFYPSPVSAFITHMVYLKNTTIQVDVAAIERLGIQCVPVESSFSESGDPIYNESILTLAIEKILLCK
ncbi:hypothetical protein G6F57_004898 [Rhizopus arrhizus]|uniref:Uncharacterized protein n=1 Tax=Rhizopus oryzae TaxID=64495 RepID=A0A9P6X8R8_RHIOR|nr:hypothetical protein G6F23_001005 [Rhizopus arrhizus]KAG1419774.1 hypothetical protein G6F58_004455 [Rhizopus delemar]KAG0792065.1 hypothetical protein G6F21_004630 [Rhizopus arrhizus]KAG0802161.1 hypothetical protein G6F22_000534 [Rhizopus arrhizus]KAG0817194.1 hypothetical protein G6F20_002584 [Rhizopus arrhizus]